MRQRGETMGQGARKQVECFLELLPSLMEIWKELVSLLFINKCLFFHFFPYKILSTFLISENRLTNVNTCTFTDLINYTPSLDKLWDILVSSSSFFFPEFCSHCLSLPVLSFWNHHQIEDKSSLWFAAHEQWKTPKLALILLFHWWPLYKHIAFKKKLANSSFCRLIRSCDG